VVGRKVLAVTIGNDHNDAVLRSVRCQLSEQRADPDHVDAAQVLARILGDHCSDVRQCFGLFGLGHLILPFLIAAVGLDRRQNQTFGR